MQAIILAAGMGKRLKELTSKVTKCMVNVNGVSLIERCLRQLDVLYLKRIVIVVGYEKDKLIEYVSRLKLATPIVYVENGEYDETNNIYSLFLARNHMLEDDTLLLESDIIFEWKMLKSLVENPYPSLALVAKYEMWMDGTVLQIDENSNIVRFVSKDEFNFDQIDDYYKTINIYKFSKNFANSHYVPFLEAYCKALGKNEYYEQVLKVITMLERPEIKALSITDEKWYEIDDVQDLDIAETIFADDDEKLEKYQKRWGGYWRYENLLDFCYLVNPFYPNQKLKDELKLNFDKLLSNYPSGMHVQCLIAAKYYGLRPEQVCVGNGAAELIKEIMNMVEGNIGIIYPTFEEYANRKPDNTIIKYEVKNENFKYSHKEIMEFYEGKEIRTLLLINPDNPSGNYIPRAEVIELLEWAEEREIRVIVDESFVDFVDVEEGSLLQLEILLRYSKLIVIKSISKSFGVPGLRIGIVVSNDLEFIKALRLNIAIWNMNSFAEYYMQIAEKYKKEYKESLILIWRVREDFYNELRTISYLRVFSSQANFLLCEVIHGYTSKMIATKLLSECNILIKDCSTKNGFHGKSYIRLAVRDEKENHMLLAALRKLEN